MSAKLKSASARTTLRLFSMTLKNHSRPLYTRFSIISGLNLNNKKTEVLWIGSCTGRDQLRPEKNLKWVKDKVKTLGVWISTNPIISMNANYDEKLENIRNCLAAGNTVDKPSWEKF